MHLITRIRVDDYRDETVDAWVERLENEGSICFKDLRDRNVIISRTRISKRESKRIRSGGHVGRLKRENVCLGESEDSDEDEEVEEEEFKDLKGRVAGLEARIEALEATIIDKNRKDNEENEKEIRKNGEGVEKQWGSESREPHSQEYQVGNRKRKRSWRKSGRCRETTSIWIPRTLNPKSTRCESAHFSRWKKEKTNGKHSSFEKADKGRGEEDKN